MVLKGKLAEMMIKIVPQVYRKYVMADRKVPFLGTKIKDSCSCNSVSLLQCCIPTKVGLGYINLSNMLNPCQIFFVLCCPLL